jgi:Ca2+-binding RTX toxin-like protein
MAIIIGRDGDDRLVGTSANDTLLGLGGADRIDAGEGDDYADGGGGNDALAGGAGTDLLDGGYGDDASDAGEGDDFVWLFEGADTVTLGPGADTLGIELFEGDPADRYGVGATVVRDFDPAEDRIGAAVSGVDAAGERVEVDLFAGFLDGNGDGVLNAADEAVYGSEGGIVLDLGLALGRALGRDDLEPQTQTVRLLGVEELGLEANVVGLDRALDELAAATGGGEIA